MKDKIWKTLKEYAIILLGSVIFAVAFDWLFEPNEIVVGGFTGLAQTLNHYISLFPVGAVVIVLNVPLFIIGIKIQGAKLLWSSIFAMVTSSLAVDILPKFIDFQPMDDHLLVCVLGGAMMGAGFGMQLLVGATTGGTELAATLLKYKFKHIQIGRICLLIDMFVVALYTIAFHTYQEALYAVIAMYVSSVTMDTVIYGRRTSKVACIICSNDSNGAELTNYLIERDLGVTEIEAKGGFSKNSKKVLICAFKPSNIAIIKNAVVEYDPDAFVIVCDAQEVYGEGFAECMLNSI